MSRTFRIPRIKKEPIVDTKAIREEKQRHGHAMIKAYAEHLRKHPTRSEQLFCELLDKLGIDYEFQPVICGYIPDFYFPQCGRKIIELDGKVHKKTRDRDRQRDKVLQKRGYRIKRIPSSLIFSNVDALIAETRQWLFPVKKEKVRKAQLPDYLSTTDPLREFMFATQGL